MLYSARIVYLHQFWQQHQNAALLSIIDRPQINDVQKCHAIRGVSANLILNFSKIAPNTASVPSAGLPSAILLSTIVDKYLLMKHYRTTMLFEPAQLREIATRNFINHVIL